MSARRRVVVADDDLALRQVLIDLLEEDPGIEVVGASGDGAETVAICLRSQPDVLVADVHMPEGGGERAAVELGRLLPELIVVAVSASTDVGTRRRMASAGARAFVAKTDLDDLIAAVLHDGREGGA